MSDIGKTRPPSSVDELSRPDAGFHDDKVGGELKSAEAARRRALEARTALKPRRIEQEARKVAATGAFGKAAREEQPHVTEAKRHQRALMAGQPQPRAQAAAADKQGDAERAMARVHTLFGAMVLLEGASRAEAQEAAHKAPEGAPARKVEAIDPDQRSASQQPDEPAPEEQPDAPSPAAQAPLMTAADRLARAHQQARFHVQHLVAGGTGFALEADPSATFASLFARLPKWPEGVPPGYTPASQSDFDSFFAWVFSPGDLADVDAWGEGVR